MSKIHADIDLPDRLSRTPQHRPTVAGIDDMCPIGSPSTTVLSPQVGEGCGVPGSRGRHCFILIPIPIFYDCNARQQ